MLRQLKCAAAFTGLITAAGFVASGCATAPKPLAACEIDIRQQNDIFGAAMDGYFPKSRYSYNWQVKVPRMRDARGRIVMEGYAIYPVTLPEPEQRPLGRKLTVVIDPCARKAVKVFEPA